jgi:hypothetical protein
MTGLLFLWILYVCSLYLTKCYKNIVNEGWCRVQQALLHERAGIVVSVDPVALTRHIVVNAAADVGHMRALSEIIAHHACSLSHEHTGTRQ